MPHKPMDYLGDRMKAYPSLTIERSEIQRLDMPPFAKVKNRVDVIFSSAEPELENESSLPSDSKIQRPPQSCLTIFAGDGVVRSFKQLREVLICLDNG